MAKWKKSIFIILSRKLKVKKTKKIENHCFRKIWIQFLNLIKICDFHLTDRHLYGSRFDFVLRHCCHRFRHHFLEEQAENGCTRGWWIRVWALKSWVNGLNVEADEWHLLWPTILVVEGSKFIWGAFKFGLNRLNDNAIESHLLLPAPLAAQQPSSLRQPNDGMTAIFSCDDPRGVCSNDVAQ